MPPRPVGLRVCATAWVLCLSCAVFAAQRVRVRTTRGIGMEGTIVKVDSQGIVLRVRGSDKPKRIPWTHVRKVDGDDPRLRAYQRRQAILRAAADAYGQRRFGAAAEQLEASAADGGPAFAMAVDCYLQLGRPTDAFKLYVRALGSPGVGSSAPATEGAFASTTLEPASLLVPDLPLPRPEDKGVATLLADWSTDRIASPQARHVAQVYRLVSRGIVGDPQAALRGLERLGRQPPGAGADLARVARAELLCLAGRADAARVAIQGDVGRVAQAVRPMWLYWAGRCEMARAPGHPMEALLRVLRVPAEYGTWRVVAGHSLLLAARCFEQLGDVASARTCYQQILANYKLSGATAVAREGLQRLAQTGT